MTHLLMSITRLAVTEVPFRGAIVPDGNMRRAKNDFQLDEWNKLPRAFRLPGWKQDVNPNGAFPDTQNLVGCGPTEFTPLPPKWLWFWYELMKTACAYRIPSDEMLRRWADATSDGRALTDKHAWNWVKGGEPKLYADIVQGLNLDSPYGPVQIKCLTMGGNMVNVLGGDDRGNALIEALDIDQDPPAVEEVWGKPWLIHWGTQSTVIPVGEAWQVIAWPQLDWGGVSYGVPFPLVGRGGRNLIPIASTEPLTAGDWWSPYL